MFQLLHPSSVGTISSPSPKSISQRSLAVTLSATSAPLALSSRRIAGMTMFWSVVVCEVLKQAPALVSKRPRGLTLLVATLFWISVFAYLSD